MNGRVLLLGVGHDHNTSLHLAEVKAHFRKKYKKEGCSCMENGARRWMEFETEELYSDDFEMIGKAFEASCTISTGKVGQADSRLFDQRSLVDFASDWMSKNRKKK